MKTEKKFLYYIQTKHNGSDNGFEYKD